MRPSVQVVTFPSVVAVHIEVASGPSVVPAPRFHRSRATRAKPKHNRQSRVGTHSLELTRGEETVFEDSFTRLGSHGGATHSLSDLEPGTYVLNATSDEGVHDLSIGLELSYSSGC